MYKTQKKIDNFIEKHNLFQKGEELVVGVSGGADSVMLLHYLYTKQPEYAYTIKVAHINHGVREQANEDAEYVKALCEKWSLPFYRHDCNIKKLAKNKNISEEEAGRIERYNFFISLINADGKIVTAHTKNDQAETILMRFYRGSDIKGLGGILPKQGQRVRPLLCVTREEVEQYCKYYHLQYKQDHTNFLPIYTRNKIRLQCIPYIKENFNKGIIETIANHAVDYQESEAFLESLTKQQYAYCVKELDDKVIIDIPSIQTNHVYMQKRIIRLAIGKLLGKLKDITSKHIQSICCLMSLEAGKCIHLPYKLVATKEYKILTLQLEKRQQIKYSYPLTLGINEYDHLPYKIILTCYKNDGIQQKQENRYTKYIDYDKIKNSLQIRTKQPNDYIKTYQGTKKLNRFFIDQKVPREIRESFPLIVDENEVVWIIGERLNTNYYITEDTSTLLEIKILEKSL